MIYKIQKLMRINHHIIQDIQNWFFNYVQSFKHGDKNFQQNIILKEQHTMRVCKEILNIGKQLELADNELRLAEIMALLHDVGRFEQYARYNTFKDQLSEDHAKLGIKILKKYDVLNKFDETTKDLILRTIEYHNRVALPQNETESCLFFAKLLRDADKLDIWKVVTNYYHRKDGSRNGAIELGLPDTPGISDEVYQDLMNKQIVDVNNIKNLNDFKLLQSGWIFDINFKQTIQIIKKRHYLEMLREVLPESNKIKKIFGLIYQHLDYQLMKETT
jgi:putative nucleotidyltransferase with HDIG domain